MILFGHTVSVLGMLMFALATFLLAGVYSLVKQGIMAGALIVLFFAAMALAAGVLQL